MRKINKLTDAAIRAAKPQDSPYKLMDGTGLYLFITPSGTKSWRYNFHLGSHQTYTYGTYPEMSLDEARKRHLIAKQQVRDGINPSEERQAKMQEVFRQKRENEFTVEVLAKEWLDVTHSQSSEKYRSTLLGRINNHILPSIGNTPVTKVEFDDLKAILRNLEQKQAFPQAKRVCQVLSSIFEYAKYLKVTDRNSK